MNLVSVRGWFGSSVPPWLEPFEPWLDTPLWRSGGGADLDVLNGLSRDAGLLTDSGRRLRFSPACACPQAGAAAYESRIWAEGVVATRTDGSGAVHDAFNALAWLGFPAIKARLNAMQAQALADASPGAPRGRLRDRLTLFDESGALFVTEDPAIERAFRLRHWAALFIEHRDRFLRSTRVLLVGHAVHEKMRAPWKGLCAHALVLHASPDLAVAELDRMAASALTRVAAAESPLSALPVLGVPGWWAANQDPGFYDDPAVFRTTRGRVPSV